MPENAMAAEISDVPPQDRKYSKGLLDMMTVLASEFIELGKFETQKRMIEAVEFPEDIIRYIDRKENK